MSAPQAADSRPAGGRVGEITAILVSWRDAEDLEASVRSLAEAFRGRARADLRVSLVAVGNGDGPASIRPDRIREIWPGALILTNETNSGLGPAANQAASAAAGDVLLFLNPDTRAIGDPFSALARGFEEHPEAVALAPRLLDADEADEAVESGEIASAAAAPAGPPHPRRLAPPGAEDQFTFQLRTLPRLWPDARELFLLDHLFPNGMARRRARYADADRTRFFAVEQAAAAALAVRADVFARLRGFDEAFVPAWFEDVDLCARLGEEGAILFWPDARFRHAGGASSERLGYDRFLPILYRNALRYRRKHYAAPARWAYRGMLAAGMVLRLAVLPLRRHVPRPRSESARAYRGVLAVVLGRHP